MHLNLMGRLFKKSAVVAVAFGITFLTGCTSTIYKVTGETMTNLGENVMVPYLLTTEDSKIACASGEALGPMLMSFSTVSTPPDQLEVLLGLVAGTCASGRAFQYELDYMRYSGEQRITQAQDARIQSKRWHAIAAIRYYASYKALVRALGEPGETCPMFEDDFQQLVWMIGAVAGLQAALSDVQSNMAVGVPFNVAPKAERGMACVDDEATDRKWWGLPKAIRAALWTIVPGSSPEGVDPWAELAKSRQVGMEEGVRMASALDGMVAYNDSNMTRVRAIIREHAESIKRTTSNREFRMLDILAGDLLLEISDRMWTENTGHRTPIGAYGTFWDDKKKTEKLDQELLDDLL